MIGIRAQANRASWTMTWHGAAGLHGAHGSMEHLEEQQQLARALSMSVVVVCNVLCAGSQPAEAARALAPASPSYDAHRQRSCGIAGRMCDP